jgi:hypothetical protein
MAADLLTYRVLSELEKVFCLLIIKLKKAGSSKGQSKAFAQGKFKIGRSTESDFYLRDASVSRVHAELEVIDSNNIFLTDLLRRCTFQYFPKQGRRPDYRQHNSS